MIDTVEHNGMIIYRHDPKSAVTIGSVDRAAFYQLKTMMQGVLQRGTARSIAGMAPFVAGKTGTSDNENDAWFVGFTNDVTVAVWIGYDNADGKRRTLGGGATGGHTAVPIFEPIMQAVWAHAAPKVALAPPSPEAKRALSCRSIDLEVGEASRPACRPAAGRSPSASVSTGPDGCSTPISAGVARGRLLHARAALRRGTEPIPLLLRLALPVATGYYDQRRYNGYYQDGQGRYIQAPRDSAPSQYGQSQQYGRDPRVQFPAARPLWTRVPGTAAHRSWLHLGPSAIVKDTQDAQP